MTRHRLTWRQSLATGFSLPTGHAYLAHTVEAERLARRVAVRMSMARTIKETLRRGADRIHHQTSASRLAGRQCVFLRNHQHVSLCCARACCACRRTHHLHRHTHRYQTCCVVRHDGLPAQRLSEARVRTILWAAEMPILAYDVQSMLLSGLGSAALSARGEGTSIPSPAGGLRAVGLSFTDFRASNQVCCPRTRPSATSRTRSAAAAARLHADIPAPAAPTTITQALATLRPPFLLF